MTTSGEKFKIQKLIEKIENDQFDANDVDSILFKLRGFTYGYKKFKEIADFIGHRDRNKGTTKLALETFNLVIKYQLEYQSKRFFIDLPFLKYIKD